mgnify:CR=1 FL=1
MDIEILGAESLGVRGMACVVRVGERTVVIDPGVALGYRRAGLPPHPVQVAVGEAVRNAILHALSEATDVVISHFHGDHMPLTDGNEYQLHLDDAAPLLRTPQLWIKDLCGETPDVADRRATLLARLEPTLTPCEDTPGETLRFSPPMPHGHDHAPMGTVMMTRIQHGRDVFVHASDIQLLADEPVERVLEWAPTIVLSSGPALYRNPSAEEMAGAERRLLRIAEVADTCIVDHHILRDLEGMAWLDQVASRARARVCCAADFMGLPRALLEARRAELYGTTETG